MSQEAIPISRNQLLTDVISEANPEKVIDEDIKRDHSVKELAESEGWQNVKKAIIGWQEAISEKLNIRDEDSLEVIGLKTLLGNSNKKWLQEVIDYVEATQENIED